MRYLRVIKFTESRKAAARGLGEERMRMECLMWTEFQYAKIEKKNLEINSDDGCTK